VEPRGAGKEIAEFMKESKRIYEEAVKSLPNPEPPHEYKGLYYDIFNKSKFCACYF